MIDGVSSVVAAVYMAGDVIRRAWWSCSLRRDGAAPLSWEAAQNSAVGFDIYGYEDLMACSPVCVRLCA